MPPPRSPSRDRSDRHIGHRRYFQTPDWLRRRKSWAVASGCVLTVLWLAVEAAHPRAASFHTHGELANPHAAWDNDCAACHKAHGLSELSLRSVVFGTRDRWHDLTCTKCHAGPAHHPAVKDAGFHDRCSNCHHDHAGRAASLTRISDDHCVGCHADLPAAHAAGATAFEPKVTDFATARGHPEFRALRDPGAAAGRRLKFSHAVHMSPGMGVGWTAAKVGELHAADPAAGKRAADRYRPRDTAAGTGLACADCHQLDPGLPDGDPAGPAFDRLAAALRGEPRAAVSPARPAGAYYLPVNFEAHCQSCHPLRAPDGVSADGAGRRTPLDGFPVPHRLQPADLKAPIAGGYAGRLAGKNPALAVSPGPGGRFDPAAPAVASFRSEVDRLTRDALKALLLNAVPAEAPAPAAADARAAAGDLYGGYACGKCHFTSGPWADPAEARIAPLPPHTVWFAHATFNHVSHRGVDCASCHPGTGTPAALPRPVVEREPVAILGADACRACHAPAGTPVPLPDGRAASAAGVRHGCTDCHKYHNGGRPLQGPGAAARDPAAPRPLAEFLGGAK